MQVRICPECESEYMPRIERCSDCDVALVDRTLPEEGEESLDAADDRDEPPTSAHPPADYVPLARRDRALDLDPLAERLGRAPLAYRVDVRPGLGFELRVRREDLAAAAALIQDQLQPGDWTPEVDSIAYEFCPACETSLVADARSCPECGLDLVFAVQACDRCGHDIDPEEGRCMQCEPAPASD